MDVCDLCALLWRCMQRHEAIITNETAIRILDSRSILRICAAPKSDSSEIQVGFPVLPVSGGEMHFTLMREWLHDCDVEHQQYHCHLASSGTVLPTRVIDVGGSKTKNSDSIRLYCKAAKNEQADYIALSHCWGDLTDEQKNQYCTTHSNLSARIRGFDMTELPKTFQDAVEVTRELGKRYLWIDSLCILQDDERDWKRESKRMGTIFHHAYCTIAASSAADSTVGFLHRRAAPHEEYVKINSSSHGPVYICTGVDDFCGDVERSLLNQRAWVLQERAMSRRTLHFTANQVYWECGMGVRCESLTYMRNSKSLFLGDPIFPNSLRFLRSRDKIELSQSLFKLYSRLGLSKSTDRTVAIAGLELRMSETFDTLSIYGIFETYLHRCLLWHRSEDMKLERIKYQETTPGWYRILGVTRTDQSVPSWSWMAYNGHIDFLRITFDAVEWDTTVKLTKESLLAVRVREFRQTANELLAAGNLILDNAYGEENGYGDAEILKCIVLGREKSPGFEVERRHFVLVVRPLGTEGTGSGAAYYTRAGVGSVTENSISYEHGFVQGIVS